MGCSFVYIDKRVVIRMREEYKITELNPRKNPYVKNDKKPTSVKMDVMPESQIQAIGIEALKSKLGVTGTLKFLEQFDNGGSGDYTKEKYEIEDEKMSKEEMHNMLK